MNKRKADRIAQQRSAVSPYCGAIGREEMRRSASPFRSGSDSEALSPVCFDGADEAFGDEENLEGFVIRASVDGAFRGGGNDGGDACGAGLKGLSEIGP